MRAALRRSFFSWEFWVVPVLFFAGLSCWVWLMNRSQDLLREQQFSASREQSVQQVTAKIQGLVSEVHRIENARQQSFQDAKKRIEVLSNQVQDLKSELKDAKRDK